jgi:hypothetical protein
VAPIITGIIVHFRFHINCIIIIIIPPIMPAMRIDLRASKFSV